MSDAENDEARAQEEAGVSWGSYRAAKGEAPRLSDPVLKPGPDGGVAIIGALIDAMEAIEAVGKENVHSGKEGEKFTGKWNYRSADDVVTAVQPALVKGGVLCVPNLVNIERERGALQMLMEYRFFARDGSSVTVRIVSNGSGNTAYTIGAAYSYALKYVLSQLLMIPFDDERMDMEAGGSMGSGELGSGELGSGGQRQERPARDPKAPWWEQAGWEDLEHLSVVRQDIVDRMRVLPEVHKEAMKLRLDALDEDWLYRTDTGRRYKGKVWQPKDKSKPKGPGSIATGPTTAAADKVLEILKSVEDEALREAAGEEPFGTEFSPRGEGEDLPPQTPEVAAAIEAEREQTPGEKLTAAREATKERSKARRASARKTGGSKASDPPEPASVAPEASEAILEGRKWLTEAILQNEGPIANQIHETLEDAGHWPIGSITDQEQMTDALTLASLVLKQETEGPAATDEETA